MANVQTYSVTVHGSLNLSKNFIVREFACKDGSDTVLVDLDLVNQLQKIRDRLGVMITISSGYRTKSHNAAVGGEPGSLHTVGRAADIMATGKTTLEVAACAESVGASGILRYITDGFVHIDTRDRCGYYNVRGGVFSPVKTFGECAHSIASIQQYLNTTYGAGLRIDGTFGPLTKRELIKGLQTEFNSQHHADLIVDGYWGPTTKAACPEIAGGTGAIPYLIQACLCCIKGYSSLTVDGIYGNATIDAVRSFQASAGLTANGIVDGNTLDALFQ